MPRITADMLARALMESEHDLPAERRTALIGVSKSEIRMRGVVDFDKWAATLNGLAFPELRTVE